MTSGARAQVLPGVILACAKDLTFRLQLCQLLVGCAEGQADGCAAFQPLLPLLKESSSAARCLAGALRSMLAGSASYAPLRTAQPQSEAQVSVSCQILTGGMPVLP